MPDTDGCILVFGCPLGDPDCLGLGAQAPDTSSGAPPHGIGMVSQRTVLWFGTEWPIAAICSYDDVLARRTELEFLHSCESQNPESLRHEGSAMAGSSPSWDDTLALTA